jgi:hypothetical protein
MPYAEAIRTGDGTGALRPPTVRFWCQKVRTGVLGGLCYRSVSPNPPYSQCTPRMDAMPPRPTTSHLPPALGARCREEDEPPQVRALSLEAGVPDPPPIRSTKQLGPVVGLEVRPPEGAEEEPPRLRAHAAPPRKQGPCLLPRFRSPGEGAAPCSHDEISAATRGGRSGYPISSGRVIRVLRKSGNENHYLISAPEKHYPQIRVPAQIGFGFGLPNLPEIYNQSI